MNGDPGSTDPLWGQIIMIIILTLINAIYAAAEMAFVNVDDFELEEEAENGDKRSQRVLKLLENNSDFLSTIQVVITFAGFLNSASASTNIASRLTPLLGNIPGAETVAVVIVTLLISYITLVFGELYPKEVAIQMPEKIAKATANLIHWSSIIFKPIIWLLSASTNLLKKITPIEFTDEQESMTRDQMRRYLERGRRDEAIDLTEFTMLKGVLSLDTKIVREIMVPRTEAYMIDYDDGTVENIDKLLDLQYSRVPMFDESKDDVLGIIHVKNLLKSSTERPLYEVDLHDITNDALFIPETLYIDDALYEMQRTNNSMAIITDEYGGVSGLLTIEDIIEEIVGDIDDEYDEETNKNVTKVKDDEWIVEGSMPLHDYNEFFNTTVSSEAVDTIAGYFIIDTGIIPSDYLSQGDEEEILHSAITGKFEITIDSIEGARIMSLKVRELDDDELNAYDDPYDNINSEDDEVNDD